MGINFILQANLKSPEMVELFWDRLEFLLRETGQYWLTIYSKKDNCYVVKMYNRFNFNEKIIFSMTDSMIIGVNKSPYKFDFSKLQHILTDSLEEICGEEYSEFIKNNSIEI